MYDRVIWRPHECPTCRQAREEEERKEAEHERQLQVLKLRQTWRTGCGIPPDLRSRTFESFDKRFHRCVFDAVYKWAIDFPQDRPVGYPSLVLYSEQYGVGKTHLVVAAANWIIDHWEGELEDAVCPVRFETGPGLVRRIRATYNIPAQQEFHETEEMVYHRLRGSALLILDDVGKETPSRHTREVYFHIINERINWGLPVLMASNLPLESLEELVGGATVSRLIAMCNEHYWHLTGEDWRRKKKRL